MKTWNNVAIVGVGLLGGSVGLALRSRKLAKVVVGTGSRPETLAAAQQLGAITSSFAEIERAVAEAELIVVCAPVGHIVGQICKIATVCRPGALITDVGSTKANIVAEIELAALSGTWVRDVHFVGSHPLAGNEKKGPRFASADLFAGRTVVVTPAARTRTEDCATIALFWTSLGASVVEMQTDEHDRAVAATSHLPHLVAAAIAGATPEQYVRLTASGWQDTTRIAAGDPLLWRQIMLANRANLLASLDGFAALLADWRRVLDAGDAMELERLLTEAKRIRDAVGN